MNNWKNPNETPKGTEGDCKEYIVAVERKHALPPGKVYVFAALYLKNMPLVPACETCLCDLSADDCAEQHEEGCPVTGWYTGTPWEGEPSGGYEKMLGADDELMGWQPHPIWSEKRLEPAKPFTQPDCPGELRQVTEDEVKQMARDDAEMLKRAAASPIRDSETGENG